MTQSYEKSVVDLGAAQRSGSWPRPGEEGFVHPDGTPQSEKQILDNRRAAADREAAGSGVHGAPAQGGVQPVSGGAEPSDLSKAQAEHTDWLREQLAEVEAVAEGKHEAPPANDSKTTDSKSG
ncbi:MAG: hypothetical protein ACRDSH_16400 [Pseudonocardiaceae bacterium]